MKLEAFVGANWAADKDDGESTGRYCVYPSGSLVSWSARKQKTVGKSSTEAEYRALSHGASEIIWLKSLLGELGCQIEVGLM